MDSSGFLRFILLGIAAFALYMVFQGSFGGGPSVVQPVPAERRLVPAPRGPEAHCDLWSDRFQARLGSHGGTLEHFRLLTAKYRQRGVPIELSTTPDPKGVQEFRQQLLTQWRAGGFSGGPKAHWQLDLDSVDYQLTRADGKACEFAYEDARVRLTKTVSLTGRPYELKVRSSIENLAREPLDHAFTIDTVAWRMESEVKGKMFRISPYVTHVECRPEGDKTTRLLPDNFEPDDFDDAHFARTETNVSGGWYELAGKPAFTSVSNAYFSQALVPLDAPASPRCQLHVEDRWDASRYARKHDDPNAGAMYRARLAYPKRTLPPGQSAHYEVLSYVGPKERQVLAGAAEGQHQLIELIDLGFFAAIAKVLVGFLLFVHGLVPNWGVAIILLTVTARTLLFPLSLPSIRNMIRMREIKPEMDALLEKYKDDAQARGVAQMELWRKHQVNPFKGCLPQLASMPVWFSLYTSLQTAVELYNIPFLWFPNLSEPDPLFILPFVIGAVFFVQQKIMPAQGGDPMQQKMMMYFMPGMFTVFMLFLPSGLGVYMFTNSLLAIGQQVMVERAVRRKVGGGSHAPGEIVVRDVGKSSSQQRRTSNQKGSQRR